MRRRRALRFLECAGGGVLGAVGLRCSVGLGAFRALRLGSIYPQDVGTDREFRVSVGDEETLASLSQLPACLAGNAWVPSMHCTSTYRVNKSVKFSVSVQYSYIVYIPYLDYSCMPSSK